MNRRCSGCRSARRSWRRSRTRSIGLRARKPDHHLKHVVQRMERDLRRRHGRSCHGRPAHPPHRAHFAQSRQLPARGHRLTDAPAGISLRSPMQIKRERRLPAPFPFYFIRHRGACGKPQVVPHNRLLTQDPTEIGGAKCVCCCRRVGGLAAQSRALGAAVPVCAPPDFAGPLARVGVPLVSPAAEGCDAPVATGVMPTRGQR